MKASRDDLALYTMQNGIGERLFRGMGEEYFLGVGIKRKKANQ
jgi:hypothetical protein